VTWLATWEDKINKHAKYVYLGSNSRFKGESDMKKYKKAQRLHKCIDKIRADYEKGMISNDRKTRQLSTAIYLIDFLALRVGTEKNTDEV
jgi:DNA topoisomerase-1